MGWMTHHTFVAAREMTVKSLGAIIGVIGGGAVTAIFQDSLLFGSYCVGVGAAFFLRVVSVPISEAVSEELRADREKAAARRKTKAAAAEGLPPAT